MTQVALIATQCFPPRIGGIERLVADFAAALAALGFAVEVFADAPGPSDDIARGVAVRRFGGPKPLRRRRKAWALARRARAARPALLIADSWKSLEHVAPGLGAGVPTLCLAHGSEYPAVASAAKAARIRAALGKADQVAAVSRYTAARAAPFAAQGRLAVIAPGIIPPQPPDAAARAALAARIGARSGPVVGTLCRLEPRKGVDMALRATAALRPRLPGIVCLIGGDGPDRPRLEALAAELTLGDAALFLGRLTDGERAALLERLDALAMPSRPEGPSVEGFGLVYIEAAAFGVPSLGGRGGGAEDAILDGETGLLCDPRDETAVTEALSRLLGDPGLRARLGAAARTRAASLGWETAARRYLAALGVTAPMDE